MNRYYFYGFILETEIDFPMLKTYDSISTEFNYLYIHLNKKYSPSKSDYVLEYKDIKYIISSESNSIFIFTNSIDLIHMTVFNVPLSAYMLLKNYVLLHCNSVEIDKRLFCFCGNKGVGKSTLELNLGKYVNVFGDDCINIRLHNNKAYGYNGNQSIKLKEDVFNRYIENADFSIYKNFISEKAVIPYSSINLNISSLLKAPINKLFFLSHGKDNLFIINEVTNIIQKKILLMKNIVGIKYLDNDILKKIINTDIYNAILNIPFYILDIPKYQYYTKKNILNLINVIS